MSDSWETDGPQLIRDLIEAIELAARTQQVSIDIPGTRVTVTDGAIGSSLSDSSATMSGDVTGLSSDNTVEAIQGSPVLEDTPETHDFLVWTGAFYEPQKLSNFVQSHAQLGPGSWTFSPPTWSKRFRAVVILGGGGGGSGRKSAAGNCGGGSGGPSGQAAYIEDYHGGLGVDVVLGAAGTGGAAKSGADANGDAGGAAADCTIAWRGMPPLTLRILGGGAGGTTGNVLSTSGAGFVWPGAQGLGGQQGGQGSGSVAGVAPTGALFASSPATSGGGGGGYSASAQNGGAGGGRAALTGSSSGWGSVGSPPTVAAGGIAGGAAAQNGGTWNAPLCVAGLGGGGGASALVTGGDGGNGGAPGGGGGGGGGGRTASGKGGDGGAAGVYLEFLP